MFNHHLVISDGHGSTMLRLGLRNCLEDFVYVNNDQQLPSAICAGSFYTRQYCNYYSTVTTVNNSTVPIAAVAQRYLVTLWHLGTWVRSRQTGFFSLKNLKTKIKMPNGWRTIKSLVHKIRPHGRRGKGKAESFSREKLRHAPPR